MDEDLITPVEGIYITFWRRKRRKRPKEAIKEPYNTYHNAAPPLTLSTAFKQALLNIQRPSIKMLYAVYAQMPLRALTKCIQYQKRSRDRCTTHITTQHLYLCS
jgi:hypothetical protein